MGNACHLPIGWRSPMCMQGRTAPHAFRGSTRRSGAKSRAASIRPGRGMRLILTMPPMFGHEIGNAGKGHPVQHIGAESAERVVRRGPLPYNLAMYSGLLARSPASEEKFHAME